MKPKLLIFFVFVAGLLAAGVPVFAHHGAAAYADKVTVLKDGTVTKFQWGNPHSIVMFDVKDDKGEVTHWAAEAGSPAALGLIGWRKTSLQPGDVISVSLYQAKSGNPVGRLQKLVLADGTTLRDSQQGGEKFNTEPGREKGAPY